MPIIMDPSAPAPAAPTVYASSDGKLTATVDPSWAGVLLKVSASTDTVQIVRDGLPIASGDPATIVAGTGYAYDPFPPLDADVTYTCGTSSVTVHTAQVPFEQAWVTPLFDPSQAVCLRTVMDTPTYGVDAQVTLSAPPGAGVRSATWDVALASAQTWVWLAGQTSPGLSVTERDQLVAALSQGPVMFRPDTSIGFDGGWMMPGDVTATRQGPYWTVSCPLTPITAPSMVGLPLVVPGHSYDQVDPAWVSYDRLAGSGMSYANLLGA